MLVRNSEHQPRNYYKNNFRGKLEINIKLIVVVKNMQIAGCGASAPISIHLLT